MNNLETTYKLTKTLVGIRDEIANWARLSRGNKLSDIHEKRMMKSAYEIDELLKEIGTEWIRDYEENQKIRVSIKNIQNNI